MDYLVTRVLQLPHSLAGHCGQVLVCANDSVQLAGIDLDVRAILPGRPGNLSLKSSRKSSIVAIVAPRWSSHPCGPARIHHPLRRNLRARTLGNFPGARPGR